MRSIFSLVGAVAKISLSISSSLAFDGVEYREIIVGDEIENGVDDEAFADAHQLGRALAARAHWRVRRRRAVADRNDKALADDQMRLAEIDAFAGELRRAEREEDDIVVDIELRSLMRLMHIFDQQLVQIELRLDAAKRGFVGLIESDPGDALAGFGGCARILDRHVAARAVAVKRAGNDARRRGGALSHDLLLCRSRGRVAHCPTPLSLLGHDIRMAYETGLRQTAQREEACRY